MPAHTESQSRRLEMLGEQEFVRSEPAANKPLDFEAGASRRPVSLILRIILGIVVCGLIAAAFFIGREVGTYESRQQTPAAAPFAFSCDARCVASAARLQGADVLTSVDALVHSIEVTFAAEADEGVGCDPNVTLRFPAYSVTLNPSLPTKLTTAETRVEPSVTFSCTSGKTYHLLLDDTLGGSFQPGRAYNHWFKVNLHCPPSGRATVSANGHDVKQGSPAISGWFSGRGYLPPAFPYNTLHHFNIFIFETAAAFPPSAVDMIDAEFPVHNQLGGIGANAAYTVSQIMGWLNFSAPVARTWMDVTTSYWSKVRMARLEAKFPPIANSTFYQLICPCNLAANQPGPFKLTPMPECNV